MSPLVQTKVKRSIEHIEIKSSPIRGLGNSGFMADERNRFAVV